MRKFGLIGFPLGHSFSKLYFEKKFESESIPDCSYENYEIKNLSLLNNKVFNDTELCGLNVTIPFKSEIFKYLDHADNEAVAIGAVNVLKISYKDGRRFVKGFNTDVFGFRESLKPHLHNRKIRKAIILGTGGSSKAVAFVLKKLDIKILTVSRRPGENLITYDELNDDLLRENKLIINTTPLGMFPLVEGLPDLNYDCLSPEHILFDLVYNPAITAFLEKGKEQGCEIIGGLNMLHLQAARAWEIWNDTGI
jgi:shikimate dehydrogenase